MVVWSLWIKVVDISDVEFFKHYNSFLILVLLQTYEEGEVKLNIIIWE